MSKPPVSDLEPCPFCGKSGGLHDSGVYMECLDCGASGPEVGYCSNATDDGSARLWNTRANPMRDWAEENQPKENRPILALSPDGECLTGERHDGRLRLLSVAGLTSVRGHGWRWRYLSEVLP